MSKKADDFYFDNFIDSIACSQKAAQMLQKILERFTIDQLPQSMDELHDIEHAGDSLRHKLTAQTAKAFITPIERDDIIKLSQNIDDITDSIEDILIQIYMTNITVIRKDSIEFANLLVKCCQAVKDLLEEFPKFKKSLNIKTKIIEINRLEEDGDRLYVKCMRTLHTTCTDPVLILSWREIFRYFEKCCDACEHTADVIEAICIGNT